MSKKAAAPSGSFRQTFSELLKARHPVLLIESKVRRVDPAGIITTFAGRGAGAYSGALGDGGPAKQAAFAFPTDLAVHDGNLYILDEGSRPRVRKVDKAGIIDTLVGQ